MIHFKITYVNYNVQHHLQANLQSLKVTDNCYILVVVA